MPIVFNADEVLEMAEQIERNGAKFYRAAADSLPDVKQLFLDLAGQEDQHEVIFSQMRAQLQGQAAEPTVFDPDSDEAMYLRAMADSHVFDVNADPTAELACGATVENVIASAIGKEKDSIAFYTGLKELVPAALGKDRMDAIVKEELGHIGWLSQKLGELTA